MNCTMYADSDASCCDWCCPLISFSLDCGISRCTRRLITPPPREPSYQFISNKLRTSATCSTVRLGSALEKHALRSLEYTKLYYHIDDCGDLSIVLCVRGFPYNSESIIRYKHSIIAVVFVHVFTIVSRTSAHSQVSTHFKGPL